MADIVNDTVVVRYNSSILCRMTEDEAISWLARSLPPIRRDGILTRDEVASALTAYLTNAASLFDEALLLRVHEKVARSSALVVLGLEELAKIPLLANAFLRFERGVEKDAWTTYWKLGGSHRTKQETILAYGQLVRASLEGDPVFSRRLYRYYAPEHALQHLDRFKQSCLYVDLRQDGIHAPTGDSGSLGALDYLLTFGQERVDSFCSWHITERRSVDYLQLGLGRKLKSEWTRHFSLPEVRADILYQAASFSASEVPDYAAFCDFVTQYKAKVSQTYLRDALVSVATLMRRRIEDGKAMPLFCARYYTAFKLMLSLSDKREIVGSTVGSIIREALGVH